MPETLQAITVGQIVAWVVGLFAIVGVIYKIWGPIKHLQNFLRDWSGKPARKDRAGRTIEESEPGVLGRLDTLRGDLDRVLKQVENSHNTNFRDDLDAVNKNIGHVSQKLDEHIKISKEHDRYQEGTQRALDEHVSSTQKWTSMLDDLHKEWYGKKRPPGSTS